MGIVFLVFKSQNYPMYCRVTNQPSQAVLKTVTKGFLDCQACSIVLDWSFHYIFGFGVFFLTFWSDSPCQSCCQVVWYGSKWRLFRNLKSKKLVFFVLEFKKFQTKRHSLMTEEIGGWGKYLGPSVFNVFVKFQ